MKLIPSNQDYRIDSLECNIEGTNCCLKWRYFGNVTHFLIVSSDAFHPFSVDEVIDSLEERKVSDENVLALGGNELWNDDEGVKRCFFISKGKYGQQDKGFKISKAKIFGGKNIPFQIKVYACLTETNGNDTEIKVVDSDDVTSKILLPVTVNFQQNVKGFFKKRAYVRIDKVQDYKDGSICYRVPEQGITIPMTGYSLGKELIVNLPGKEPLNFFVAKEYKSIYTLRENKYGGRR